MISLADLDRLLALMQSHGLTVLEVKDGDARLLLRLPETDALPPPPERVEVPVRTRALGTFLPAHPRRAAPPVKTGDRVEPDTIIGFLQSGPALLPILAGAAGEVGRIEAEAGALLGYGAPVLTLLVEK